MSAKSITQQIEQLEKENMELRHYEDLLNSIIKKEFGISISAVKRLIAEQESNASFLNKILTYFKLQTDLDKSNFSYIICNQSIAEYYWKRLAAIEESDSKNG